MVRLNHSSFHKLIEILLLIVAIRSVAIGYCNKNFVAIAFCYNKIFLLLLKTIYWDKNYCCYNLFQQNICCDRLLLQ